MSWKKSDADNPPTQTPVQPPPWTPRSQPPAGKERALIGPSIVIKGNLSGDEDLYVEGRVEGQIELPQHGITIGKSGRIKADIRGRDIIVMGEVEGNLFASEQIVLRQSSTVRGNLVAPRVSLEDGSNFKGSIDMTSKPAEEENPSAAANTEVTPASEPTPRQEKTEDQA